MSNNINVSPIRGDASSMAREAIPDVAFSHVLHQ
jgi:hypothetical protein